MGGQTGHILPVQKKGRQEAQELKEMLRPLSQGRVCGDCTNHAGFVAGPRRLPSLRGQDNKGETLLYHGTCRQASPRPGGYSQEESSSLLPRGLKALEGMLTLLPTLPAGQMLLDPAQGLKTKTNSPPPGAGRTSLSAALG